MNDKFNDDDFSWLSDPDDPDKKKDSSQDDESFSWQQSDESRRTDQSGPRSGVTGQLSWQKDESATGDDESADDDEGFAWQAGGTDSPATPNRTGLTGTLSWQRENQPEKSSSDWMNEFSSSFDKMAASEDEPVQDDAPDWLKAAAPTASQPPQVDDSFVEPGSDMPSWLQGTDDAEDDLYSTPAAAPIEDTFEPQGSNLPSWLQGDDDEVEKYDTPQVKRVDDSFVEPGSDMPSWLQGDDDSSDDDLYSTPAAASTSDAPSWLSGYDEPAAPAAQASNFDDLFADSPTSASDDAPDWLSGYDEEPAVPAPTAAQTSTPAANLDDLFGDDPIDDDAPDWLSGLGAAGAAPEPAAAQIPNLDDLFAAADAPDWDDAPEPAAAEVPNLDDLFGADDEPDEQQWEAPAWENQAPQQEEDVAFDDLFPMMDDEEEEVEDAGAPLDTGFLSSMGLGKPTASQAESAQSASVDDFLAGLGFGDDDGEPALSSASVSVPPPAPAPGDDDFDWFAGQTEEEAVPAADDADWLEGLGDLDTLTALTDEAEQPEAFPVAEDDDPFADFETPEIPEPAIRGQYQDIDDLMAAFGDDEMDLPKTDELRLKGDDIDFDTLLNQDALGDVGRKKPATSFTPDFAPGSADLLADLGVTVGQTSASSIMRQQQDRPLDELSDRLQALRERGMDAPASPVVKASTSLAGVLPGVSETLPPAPLQTGTPSIAGAVILGKEQQDRVALLRQLVGSGAQAVVQGEDAPYTDWESELPAETTSTKKAKPVVRPRRRFSFKLDRVLISVLLIAVIALPFLFDAAQIGSLPPVEFTPGTSQYAVYDSINTLSSGDLVLVAVEYGPTAAGELDSMTDALLRHIMARGAHPVVVSRNAVGLLHANNLLLATGGTANEDYYVARYVTADIVGLRSLAQNITATLINDINGNPTGLNVASLDDFARIVVIVERAEDLRAWAEQIAPLTSTPLLAGTNFAAGPLSQPYLNAGLGTSTGLIGLLIGAGDAYTYQAMVEGWIAQGVPPSTPTEETPTETPVTPTEQPLIGDETEEATEDATEETDEPSTPRAITGTSEPQASDTPEPSPTREQATPTLAPPSSTPTVSASATPRPTITPTFEPVAVFAFVSVSDTVNVRAEPNRTAPALTTVRSGGRVEVLGASDDGLWLNVRTTDGTEGWILAELLTIESAPKPVAMQRQAGADVNQDTTPEATPESDEATEEAEPTLRPTRTPVIEETPTAEATPEAAIATAGSDSRGSRDNQWYATTLGLVFIVVVITLGNMVNLIRGLLRRSRAR